MEINEICIPQVTYLGALRCVTVTYVQVHQHANYKYVIGKVENLAKYDAQYYYKAILDLDV